MGENLVKEIITSLKDVNKRLVVVIVILVASLLATNAYWIYDYTQWEYVEEEYIVETDGDQSPAIINTGGGEVDVKGEIYQEDKE